MIMLVLQGATVYDPPAMGRIIRRNEIHARRARRLKLRALRARYKAAKSATEKEKILSKIGRIVPWLKEEEAVGKGK